MEPSQWQRVSEVFDEICLIPENDLRELRLREIEHDPFIYSEVCKLLKSHSQLDDFLESPVYFSAAAMDMPLPKEGDTLGDFILQKKLGQGSFGSVFLAFQKSLNRDVALKITPNLGEEARMMAPLEHENIVRVFSETIDGESGHRLMCMQYIPGVSLDVLMKDLRERPLKTWTAKEVFRRLDTLYSGKSKFSPMELKEREKVEHYDFVEFVLWMGEKISHALQKAHERGILHLDVKPGNILLNPLGIPFLTDFNVSLEGLENQTQSRMIGGTYRYMSPEHKRFLDGEKTTLTPTTDLFSLATILKELIDLSPVPAQESIPFNRAVETELGRVISSALDESPTARPPSASEFAANLSATLELRQIAECMPPLPRFYRLGVRFPLLICVFLVVLPHMVLSFINIVHNEVRIVDELTLSQQILFEKLVLFYNPVSYSVCIFLGLRSLKKIAAVVRRTKGYRRRDSDEQSYLRRKLLALPIPLSVIPAFGWIPGAIFFPTALHLLSGVVHWSVFVHFIISNILCWAMAMTYVYLYLESFLLRAIYPMTLIGLSRVRERAAREIGRPLGRLSFFYWAVGLLPLVGILLSMTLSVKAHYTPKEFLNLRILIFSLAAVAGVGFVTAIRERYVVEETYFALTGQKRRDLAREKSS